MVDALQPTTRRRRARPAPAPAAPPRVPTRELPQGAAKTYRTFEVANPSKGGGAWQVDWERAHADAQQVLDAIDFSKRDIVLWVPGTSSHGPNPKFEAAVRDSYKGEGTNLVALQYEASWHLRRSLPTGIATLRLVLEGIRQRGGDHRVLVGGESQGAWVAGEVLADPAVSSVVDRAVLLGHPWLAKHQYVQGQDPRVRVINHRGDSVTLEVKGDPTVGLDAMIAVRTLQLTRVGDVLAALASNPAHGYSLLTNLLHSVPLIKSLLRNPHVYDGDMTRAVEYLRHGALPFSREFLQLAGLPTSRLLSEPDHDEEAHRRLLAGAAILAYSGAAA